MKRLRPVDVLELPTIGEYRRWKEAERLALLIHDNDPIHKRAVEKQVEILRQGYKHAAKG